VIDGADKLRNGAKVTVRDSTPAPVAAPTAASAPPTAGKTAPGAASTPPSAPTATPAAPSAAAPAPESAPVAGAPQRQGGSRRSRDAP
jgi:hypothetical protein